MIPYMIVSKKSNPEGFRHYFVPLLKFQAIFLLYSTKITWSDPHHPNFTGMEKRQKKNNLSILLIALSDFWTFRRLWIWILKAEAFTRKDNKDNWSISITTTTYILHCKVRFWSFVTYRKCFLYIKPNYFKNQNNCIST